MCSDTESESDRGNSNRARSKNFSHHGHKPSYKASSSKQQVPPTRYVCRHCDSQKYFSVKKIAPGELTSGRCSFCNQEDSYLDGDEYNENSPQSKRSHGHKVSKSNGHSSFNPNVAVREVVGEFDRYDSGGPSMMHTGSAREGASSRSSSSFNPSVPVREEKGPRRKSRKFSRERNRDYLHRTDSSEE